MRVCISCVEKVESHHVAAYAEEDAVSQAQHAQETPHEVQRQRQQREAHDLPHQIHNEQ